MTGGAAEARLPAAARPPGASVLQALWFVVVPALLSALVYRRFTPSSSVLAEGSLLRVVADAAERYPVPFVAGLFLLFATVFRYWRKLLPGAAYLEDSASSASTSSARQLLFWCLALSGAAGAALLLRGVFFQSYRVLSSSMLPSLAPDDQLLSNERAYRASFWSRGASRLPARGEIVVFEQDWDASSPRQLVKRVIGLPGDTVKMRGGHAVISGWEVPSCDAGRYLYVVGDRMLDARLVVEFLGEGAFLTAYSASVRPPAEAYAVKPGEVFVLGDNRNNSSDSRAWQAGKGAGLPLHAIRGRAERFLFGKRRRGDLDFSRLLEPLGLGVTLEGMDPAVLRAGIARCMAQRPKVTHPPTPTASGSPP